MKDLILMFAQGDHLELNELEQVESKLLELRSALKGTGLLFKSTRDLVDNELTRVNLTLINLDN